MSLLHFTALVAIIAFVVLLSSSSSSSALVAAWGGGGGGDSTNPISPSWVQAFESLVATFKEVPRYRQELVALMLDTQNTKDVNYGEKFCSTLSFVKCVVPAGSSLSPSSAMAPVSLAFAIEVIVTTDHQQLSAVRWSSLPRNTRTVKLRNIILFVPVDLRSVLKGVPREVESFVVESCHVSNEGSKKNSGENQNPLQDSALDSLSFSNSIIDASFVNEAASWFASKRLPMKRVSIVECVLLGGSNLGTFIAPIENLEELTIRENVVTQSLMTIPEDDTHTARTSNSAFFNAIVGKSMSMTVFPVLEQIESHSSRLRVLDLVAAKHDDGAVVVQSLGAAKEAGWFSKLATLAALENLRLGNIALTNSPPTLPSTIKTLRLTGCTKLTKFPDLAEYPASLEEIDLDGCGLTALPPASAIPTHVTRVRLPHNKIAGSLDAKREGAHIPKHLVEYNIAHNELTGSVDLTRLPFHLEVFDISFNKFSGPVNLRELPDSIRHVLINDNEFTGRYDVSRLPLLSVRVMFGNNNWDSLMPPRMKMENENNNDNKDLQRKKRKRQQQNNKKN